MNFLEFLLIEGDKWKEAEDIIYENNIKKVEGGVK